MGFNLDVLRAQVDSLFDAKDDELSQLRRNRLIKQAVEKYSSDRPDTYTEDEAGDGGRYYKLVGTGAVLANWVDGFSQVLRIEYPAAVIASDQTPVYLEEGDWEDDYESAGDVYLFLPNHTPAATETMRIKYTLPWTWTNSTSATVSETQTAHGFVAGDYIYREESGRWVEANDQKIATHKVTAAATADTFTAGLLEVNIPAGDFFAVCALAGAYCCQAIAGKYSRTSDSSIAADSVDHPTRAQQFAARAKELLKVYMEHVGVKDTHEKAAGAFADWDTGPTWPAGRQFIFHGRGTR